MSFFDILNLRLFFWKKGGLFIGEKFIKIPGWIAYPDEQYSKILNLHRFPVFCHLYQNTTIMHRTSFSPEEYCIQNQKTTTSEKRNALQKAEQILQFLVKHNFLTEVARYKNKIVYDMSYQNLILWTPFTLLTEEEFKKITYNPLPETKNKGALLSVLCTIKNAINRTDDKTPKNVCSYRTSTLAKKSGLNKMTFLKYLHQLEDMALIQHKILHIPSKNKNKFWNFTLNVCTSVTDYQEHLLQAEIFLKERYKGKYKPADYDDED